MVFAVDTNVTTLLDFRYRHKYKAERGVDGAKKDMFGKHGGDVILTVRQLPHALFERKGDDLVVDIPVSYLVAVLGGEMQVPTMNGKTLTVKLPAGTQSGQQLRLTGKGMPHLKNGGHGDLYARVKITVPKILSERERTLLTELATLTGGV